MLRAYLVPLVLGLVTVALSACGSDDASGTPQTTDPAPTLPPVTTPPPPELDGREFVLTGLDGHELVADTTIRLVFDDGSVSANAGCNTLFGGYSWEGDRLAVDTMGSTDIACEPDRMAQDRWLTDVFQLRPVVSVDGDVLTVRGPAGAVLTFTDRRIAEPDLALEDVRWVADGLRSQDAMSTLPDGVVVAFTFDSERVTVEAGCNRGSAGYEVDGDVITVGPLALTRMMCEPDAMEVEALVTGLLEQPVTFRIDADRLTIDSADTGTGTDDEPAEMLGTGITFVAETD